MGEITRRIIAVFTATGTPVTGLTPTYYIYTDTSATAVTGTMSEIGTGVYYVDYTSFQNGKRYTVYIDGGGAMIGLDTHKYAHINMTPYEPHVVVASRKVYLG